jgi:LPS export ABC transporter permease LptF
MFRILDRYLVREIALPFVLGLIVLSFILELPPILTMGEDLISRGVEWTVIGRVLVTLLPQALCLTIPMSVLLGILVGFGRLSADREFVAMQACGISLLRLARPVLLISVLGTAATAYQTIVALPNANQTFREIVFVEMAQRIENNIKPRVFFQDFSPKVLYVLDVPPEGGWRSVFLADTTNQGETTVYFAKEGRIHLDREKKLVQLELRQVTWHTTRTSKPEELDNGAAESFLVSLDPTAVFKRPPARGAKEMTYAELYKEIADAATRNDPAYEAHFMIQQKLSLPLACPILALIGLGLGATNRKDGKLASFAIGMVVIFVYYVLLWGSRSFALGGQMNPALAPWTPNLVLGIVAIALMIWRARSADRPIRFSIPMFWKRKASSDAALAASTHHPPVRPRIVVVIRVPHLNIPMPKLLDLYLSREYSRVLLLGLFSLLGVFYLSTFIDLVDKLFRGETDTATMLRFFYFSTPQFVFFIIPMSVLLATLVTIGLMTKNGELLVMRACGISLYRSAAPLLLFGAAASLALFFLQERVLTKTNPEADRLQRQIRGWGAVTPRGMGGSGPRLDRRWMVGSAGAIYHYDGFDATANRFDNLLVYQLDEASWQLRGVTRATRATLTRRIADGPDSPAVWTALSGWSRELPAKPAPKGAAAVTFAPFESKELTLEAPEYFKSDDPIADFMTYAELREYIRRLRSSGANVVPQTVALQRKVAFPFVTIIMTVLAIPFAVTTGRRGAMYGIGIGIVIAISYWTLMSVAGALGAGGVLTPMLAAWTPNILFGAAAVYMVLTVRT